ELDGNRRQLAGGIRLRDQGHCPYSWLNLTRPGCYNSMNTICRADIHMAYHAPLARCAADIEKTAGTLLFSSERQSIVHIIRLPFRLPEGCSSSLPPDECPVRFILLTDLLPRGYPKGLIR